MEPLPYTWYAPHSHDHQEAHQHFGDHGQPDAHAHVALVPFNPTEQGSEQDLQVVVARLRADNQQAAIALTRQGVGVNPVKVQEVRLRLLVETLLQDPKARLRFEIRYETAMAEVIDQVRSEVARAKLAASAPPIKAPPANPNGTRIITPPGFGR